MSLNFITKSVPFIIMGISFFSFARPTGSSELTHGDVVREEVSRPLPSPIKKTKQVDCATPERLSGNLNAKIKGTLKLSQLETGAYKAEGELQIHLNKLGAASFDKKEKVRGQYDNIHGKEYATLGAVNNPKIGIVYLNFSETGLSYIEYKSERYLLDCK